jgi:hypothetical protein
MTPVARPKRSARLTYAGGLVPGNEIISSSPTWRSSESCLAALTAPAGGFVTVAARFAPLFPVPAPTAIPTIRAISAATASATRRRRAGPGGGWGSIAPQP